MPRGATEAFVQAALGSHQRKMVAALTAILAPHRDGRPPRRTARSSPPHELRHRREPDRRSL
jgi:hypothetical protein